MRVELTSPRGDTPDDTRRDTRNKKRKRNSHVRIAIKPIPVRRKRRRVVDQRRRQVVALLELIHGVLAVALGIGAVADEDLSGSQSVRQSLQEVVVVVGNWTYTSDRAAVEVERVRDRDGEREGGWVDHAGEEEGEQGREVHGCWCCCLGCVVGVVVMGVVVIVMVLLLDVGLSLCGQRA